MSYQVIVTAASSSNYSHPQTGVKIGKYWHRQYDKTLIQHSLDAHLGQGEIESRLVLSSVDHQNWLDSGLERKYPGLSVTQLMKPTKGALCSALLAVSKLDFELPLLILPGDSYATTKPGDVVQEFLGLGSVAGTLVHSSRDPKLSFARIHSTNRISEMVEKKVVSNHASTGLFFFRTVKDFVDASTWVLTQNMSVQGNFFISSALNYLVMAGQPVHAAFMALKDEYHRFGVEDEFRRYIGVQHEN